MNPRQLVTLCVVAALTACGGDDASVAGPESSTTVPPATTMVTTPPVTTTVTTTGATTGATTVTTTTVEPAATLQPALWPAAEVVFDTPEAAAEEFVSDVLDVPPVLGEFRPGDARSGEIVVYSPSDDDDPTTNLERGIVFLRQLGPHDGWFVIGAASEGVSITSPETGDLLSAGPVVVEGLGRGFEATLVIRAMIAGDAGSVFDTEIAMTDWMTPVAYSVELDLSAALPGDVVVLFARGASGLETDPSEFAAIPIVIGG